MQIFSGCTEHLQQKSYSAVILFQASPSSGETRLYANDYDTPDVDGRGLRLRPH